MWESECEDILRTAVQLSEAPSANPSKRRSHGAPNSLGALGFQASSAAQRSGLHLDSCLCWWSTRKRVQRARTGDQCHFGSRVLEFGNAIPLLTTFARFGRGARDQFLLSRQRHT